MIVLANGKVVNIKNEKLEGLNQMKGNYMTLNIIQYLVEKKIL